MMNKVEERIRSSTLFPYQQTPASVDHIIPNDILFPEVERLIHEGKTVTLTPRGQSMLPFIRGGEDLVELQAADNISVGDVLLVRLKNGVYVLHRLIRREGDLLTLRGDGNLQGEESCSTEDVIAKVVAVYNSSGKKKRLSRARLWQTLFPIRKYLLKIYRKSYKIFHS